MGHFHAYAISLLFATCSVLAFWLASELRDKKAMAASFERERVNYEQDAVDLRTEIGRIHDRHALVVGQLRDELAAERTVILHILAASAPVQVAAVVGYQPAVDRVVEAKDNADLHDILLSRGG